jgi:hypothetical protein
MQIKQYKCLVAVNKWFEIILFSEKIHFLIFRIVYKIRRKGKVFVLLKDNLTFLFSSILLVLQSKIVKFITLFTNMYKFH